MDEAACRLAGQRIRPSRNALRDDARVWLFVALLVGFAAVGCTLSTASPSPLPTGSPTPSESVVRYVALGDSYTIGTSVGEADRWPDQLVARLAGRVSLELVANLGVNGYSSADLIRVELPVLGDLRPDFVTVLIGVNDVVRGVPAETYRANLATIFDALLGRLPAGRIVVVSTPDYTQTPAGASFGDPVQQRAAIGEFNGIERDMAAARGIAFVDISSVADAVGHDPALVAVDGLHPSGKQYAGWVELVAPVVAGLFER
jgi:acyl-CoA thioesterase I